MEKKDKVSKSKKRLYLLVSVMVIASIAYRLLTELKLEQTSLLFIGLPALITIIMIKYTKKPKSAYGIMFYVISLFLLISSIFLGEGIICIIMAAPLFYGVAALLVSVYLILKKRNKSKLYSYVVLPIIFIVAQPFSYPSKSNKQTITTSIIVNSRVTLNEFNSSPILKNNLPSFLKIGFPLPVNVNGKGLELGSLRTIQFKSTTKGIGSLVLEVVDKSDSEIIFKSISDESHISHWLTWDKMVVKLENVSNNKTKITWTTSFNCELGPNWYFEMIEVYAVKLMNKHLIYAYFN